MSEIYYEKKNGDTVLLSPNIESDLKLNIIKSNDGLLIEYGNTHLKSGDILTISDQFIKTLVLLISRDRAGGINGFANSGIVHHWISATQFRIYSESNETDDIYLHYLAIGLWK